MERFVIEKGILKAYFGKDEVVVVPDGVTHIGGCLGDFSDTTCPANLKGDSISYKAFYTNSNIKELYLPDSTVEIGFKSLEHCNSLEVLSFSSNMKVFGCNAINGCTSLRKIIYRGTVFEFSCLETPGQTPDLEVVYCTDGEIRFGSPALPGIQYHRSFAVFRQLPDMAQKLREIEKRVNKLEE